MENFFTYVLKADEEILRIGKGHTFLKSGQSVRKYINDRRSYKNIPADTIEVYWNASESSAYKKETQLIGEYFEEHGCYPPYNTRHGGGGRHIYLKCKAFQRNGLKCPKEALAGNYGYCGRHRRY